LKYSNKPFDIALNELFSSSPMGLREFARKTGVNYSYLSKLRNGRMPPPSDDVIQKIARGFKVPVDYFLEFRLRCVYRALLIDPDFVTALHYVSKQSVPRQKQIKKRFISFVKKEVSAN